MDPVTLVTLSTAGFLVSMARSVWAKRHELLADARARRLLRSHYEKRASVIENLTDIARVLDIEDLRAFIATIPESSVKTAFVTALAEPDPIPAVLVVLNRILISAPAHAKVPSTTEAK
jgi:Zn-dependent protease with chaperone function